MLPAVGNVGQNNYNTSFGCKGNANKIVQQLSKKQAEISPEVFDKIALTDPVANAAQKLQAGLMSKGEFKEVVMRDFAGKMTFRNFIKSIFKK